jgi:AmpD protein
MAIINKPIGNYSKRKYGLIDAIVIHYISAIYSNPPHPYDIDEIYEILTEWKGSYHYLINREGDIYQLVSEEHKAWHAGLSNLHGKRNVNEFSIGIAFMATPKASFTDHQYREGIKVCQDIRNRYKIPLNRIVGHEHIAPRRKLDPGPNFDWITFLDGIA